jgi:pyruvate,water dikinase
MMQTQLDTRLVVTLDDPSATLEQVGGKGASLARLASAGLPVPPGFHITTAAYRRFVTENGLQEPILAAVSEVSASEPAALEEASKQIASLFAQSRIPDDLVGAISLAYAGLGEGDRPVAVRSSATAEDLPEMSFAGQQESYLNIRSEAMVLEAVKRCFASLWTARAIGYRARHHIAPEEVSLAVVVQELVPAEAAGILFTANPLTGASDQVMINAAWGLGEAIVGGLVTPDTVVVDKASGSLLTQEIADKQVMTVRTQLGTREEPVPAEQRTRAVLSAAQAAELTGIGVQIERLYDRPMDIEWAMRDGLFFIVQARPITALRQAEARPVVASPMEWNTPNPRGRYMRGSMIELLPDPLSPLCATLALPAWSKAAVAWQEYIGWGNVLSTDPFPLINGYAYYDFTIKSSARLILALPRSGAAMTKQLRSARKRWEQEALPAYVEVVRRWETSDLHAASAAHLLIGAREIISLAGEYYMTIMDGVLPAARFSEALFKWVYERLLKRRDDPPALTFLLGYESEPIRAEKSLYELAQWARAQAGLPEALGRMSSAEFAEASQAEQMAAVDQETWSGFRQRFATHLAQFGHLIYDLDFAKAVPADDPAPLLETLKFFLSGDAPDPAARQAGSAAAREHAMRTLAARRPGLRRALCRRLVQKAQRFAPLREDALAAQGLGWPVLRRMLREMGQRLVAAGACQERDEVFWLTADELQAAVQALDGEEAVAHFQASVRERRLLWEQQRQLTPPASLPLKEDARMLGINMSWWAPAQTDQQADEVIKGIGASPGRITGQVSVIHGPDEFDQMHPGTILVTKITTPAWTPLFALAAGVVTDVGGPLSHSSIVAREYHIPAVLGTGVATERLQSGQRVTVDGDAGTVRIIHA